MSDQYNFKEETFITVVKVVGGLILTAITKYALKGIKYSYRFYQERKDLTIQYNIGFVKLFWFIIFLIVLALIYLSIEISSTRQAVKDIIGDAQGYKQLNEHVFKNDSTIKANDFRANGRIDSIRMQIDKNTNEILNRMK